MADHEGAVVLHAAVALDRRHRHPAGKAHHRDDEADKRRLPGLERRSRPPEDGGEERRARGTAEEAFPGARRAHLGGHGPTARHPAPDILHAVGKLHQENEEEEEAEVGAAAGFLPTDPHVEERRGEGEAVDADDQAGLDLRRPFEEALVVTCHRHPGEHEERAVEREEDAEQVVAVVGDEDVVERREQEEHPEQRAVVPLARGGKRDELAEGPERHEPTEDHRRRRPEPEGRGEDGADDPPAAEAEVEHVHGCRVEAAVWLAGEELPYGGGHREEEEHPGDEGDRADVVHGRAFIP